MACGPIHQYTNPPIPGPESVINAIPDAFNATAFVNSPSGTSCGMIAWRAGIMNDQHRPCVSAPPNSTQIDTKSITIEIATTSATKLTISWAYWIILRRFQRSASEPPNNPKINIGGANPAPTNATKNASCVKSHAS